MCSRQLEELLTSVYHRSWEELLGELQLAFVLFFHLSSLGALHQWKHMMWLLCSCESSPFVYPQLYASFLRVLSAQLQQIPRDFFTEDLSEENFIISSVVSLFEILQVEDHEKPDRDVMKWAERVKRLLKSRFDVDLCHFGCFDLADSSCAPVLVIPNEKEKPTPAQSSLQEDALNRFIANQFLNRVR